MPSPIGHLLAGAAIGFLAEPAASSASPTTHWRWPVLAAAVAALPDADLLIPHFHRAGAHSVFVTAMVFIVTIGVTRQVTGKFGVRLAVVLALAHASHLLLDWLGADPNPPSGIQLWWPVSIESYVSGLDWFPGTERRLGHPDLVATNLRALGAELLRVGPMALAAWWWATRKRRSLVPTSVPDIQPPPSA